MNHNACAVLDRPAVSIPVPMPIETAPKDGTLFIVLTWHRDTWTEVAPATFETDQRILIGNAPGWYHDDRGDRLEPTHWLAWPDAPEAQS